MNLVIGAFPYFALPFVISLALVPVAKRIGLLLGIYAVENKRTVHHGRIVRIGGVAIYIAFLLSLAILWRTDSKLIGILLGGCLVFIGGLLDDIYDLSPKYKLLFQFSGAVAARASGATVSLCAFCGYRRRGRNHAPSSCPDPLRPVVDRSPRDFPPILMASWGIASQS